MGNSLKICNKRQPDKHLFVHGHGRVWAAAGGDVPGQSSTGSCGVKHLPVLDIFVGIESANQSGA